MSFLPQEFSCSNKRSWVFKFPSHNVTPLIEQHWQVSIWSNPFCKGWVHDSLRSWPDSNWFLKITCSIFCDPCNLSRKSLNMILLFVKSICCNKHWEVTILNTDSFEFFIHVALDLFPDVVRNWSENVASWNIVVLNHICLGNNLLIPFWKVLFFSVLYTFLVDSLFWLLFLLFLLLLLLLFWLFLRFWFLSFFATCSGLSTTSSCCWGKSCKVNYHWFMLRSSNDLVHGIHCDCCCSCVNHWMEPNIFKFMCQSLIKN